MRDTVIIISIASGLLAAVALCKAVWHTCRIEWLRHHPGDR